MSNEAPVAPSTDVAPSIKESPFKAKVRMVLMADDLVVADSDDTALWSFALGHIVRNEKLP